MMKQRHSICLVDDLPPGERKIVQIGRRSIGIFNVAGTFHAIKNVCPHQGAELCRGPIGGTMLPGPPGEYRYGLEGRVLRCPWHFWEFDVTTGEMVFMPDHLRVKTYEVVVEKRPFLEKYPVTIEANEVVVYL